MAYGGGAYGSAYLDRTVEYVSAVHSKGVIIWDITNNQEQKYPNEGISPKIWTNFPNGRLSLFITTSGTFPGMTYIEQTLSVIRLVSFTTGETAVSVSCSNWGHNTNTNVIPSSIIQNADGSIMVTYTNHAGVKREHTFKGW